MAQRPLVGCRRTGKSTLGSQKRGVVQTPALELGADWTEVGGRCCIGTPFRLATPVSAWWCEGSIPLSKVDLGHRRGRYGIRREADEGIDTRLLVDGWEAGFETSLC